MAEELMMVEWERMNVPRFVMAFSAAVLVEDVFVYPLLLLKTRQQVDRKLNFQMLKGTFYDLNHIAKTEGIKRGLFRGFWSYTGLNMPPYALYFIFYHRAKHYFSSFQFEGENDSKVKKMAERAIRVSAPMSAAIASEVVTNVLFVPADVIVQRLQVVDSPYKNGREAMRRIWRDEGWRGFYRGFGATLITFGISSSVWWMTYEYSKPFLSDLIDNSPVDNHPVDDKNDKYENEGNGRVEGEGKGKRKVSVVVQSISGFMAGVFATFVSNPFDVVKTRLQTQHVTNHSPSSPSPHLPPPSSALYKNSWDGIKWIIKTEGYRGFTRGFFAKMVRVGPLSAISSVVYEAALAWSMK